MIRSLLARFAKAETPFALEDIVLRAAGCALHDVAELRLLDGQPVALEPQSLERRLQIVLSDIRKGSLAPLRARRLAALEAGIDQSARPATLSLRLLEAGDIRPLAMPLLAGRPMRLVLAAGTDAAECLLSFDAGQIDEDAVAAFLTRFKGYIEVPLRLLA